MNTKNELPTRLQFELNLLGRMTRPIRDRVLHRAGIEPSVLADVQRSHFIRIYDQLKLPVSELSRVLGSAVSTEDLPRTPAVHGLTTVEHKFKLVLWPDLCWVASALPDGEVWDVGFRNRKTPSREAFAPALVRAGEWTRYSLHNFAKEPIIYDGWDESVVERFTFGTAVYQGAFFAGLLQEWQEVVDGISPFVWRLPDA
jgi:hypothetical protein